MAIATFAPGRGSLTKTEGSVRVGQSRLPRPGQSRIVCSALGALELKGTKQMKRFALVVSVIAALGVCSVALAASSLSGSYKTKITSTALGGALKGTWTLKLKNGVFTAAKSGTVQGQGTYSIKGPKITFHDKPHAGGCKSPGVFKFKLTGKKLKFTRVSGSSTGACKPRAIVLAGSFTKVG